MSRNHFLFLLLPIAAGVACSSPTSSTGGTATVPKILVADAGGNDRIDGFDDIKGANWITVSTPSPSSVALDADGRIYVTDNSNNRIVRMDSISGAGAVPFGTTGAGTGQFSDPVGVFVDGSGKIYVADWGNNRIVRIDDMTGANWTVLPVSHPGAIFVDGTGRIYAAEYIDDRIDRFDDMSGSNPKVYGSNGNGVGQFSSPRGLYVDGTGRIYVADDLNNRVVRIDDMLGTNWAEVRRNSTDATDSLLGPAGVSVVGSKLFVTSYKSSRVVEMDITMSGSNWQSLGSHGTGVKQFGAPLGIVAH
jgi:streptogramin lyase